ncbi:OB-fold protein [Streptomyces enissocaesilis]|uniref:Lipoprotein n=1 Tax=Streptomyces enissocaesilis TaxID=332589 RepID=A0ABN3XQS6_9ACTN
MRHGKILTGALALLVVLTGCAGAGAEDPAFTPASGGASATPTPVQIRDLHDQFTNDRTRAEKECYGQSVTVRAVVLKTGASEYGTPTIEASDVRNGTHLASIVLPYDDRRAESFRRLESVKTGQEIAATATCNVFVDRNSILIFKNAEIVE